MRILVTGFDPFGGESINPSMEAVKRLPEKIGNAGILKVELPTSFARATEKIQNAIDTYRPDCVLCVGQAGGRHGVSVERVAINLADASIVDNDGELRHDMPLVKEGKNAYFATLPVGKMVEAVRGKGIPACISLSAGAFVCNSVFYTCLHHCEKMGYGAKCGFVHIPYIPEQCVKKGNVPSMALETDIAALLAILEVIAQ